MSKGKLYLIPSPLGDNTIKEVLPQYVLDIASSLDCFVVEELRTARRFLSAYGLKGRIDTLDFHIINEHTKPEEISGLSHLFDNEHNVGLMSEAGLPAVADPGSGLVALCHNIGVEVVPLVGPSSLMLALMASGLNGQSFAFCGYIPAKADERKTALKALEKRSASGSISQIIIETPYRNDALLKDMLTILSDNTRLCIAADISLSSQFIKTKTIAAWRKTDLCIGKRPCVFIILAK